MSIKVLHVVSSLGSGGVEQMLLNYYKNLDLNEISFDFIVHGNDIGVLEETFSKMGSIIHHAPPKKSSFWGNLRFISKVIREGKYDVVHAHQNLSSLIPLALARVHGVPVRISHGHGYPSMFPPLASVMKVGIEITANYYFACTEEAGRWLHPRKWMSANSSKFVMTNAFELSRFEFDPNARKDWREKLQLGSFPVIIQVGRLSAEKNHTFTLTVFERLRTCGPWKLVIVGEGELLAPLKQQADELGISEHIKFTGFQSDIRGLLSASDIAVMPSITEGLGLAAVEAQVAGLIVLAASALPSEVQVSDRIRFLDLDLENWTDQILEDQLKLHSRDIEITPEILEYSIDPAAARYAEFLSEITSRNLRENL